MSCSAVTRLALVPQPEHDRLGRGRGRVVAAVRRGAHARGDARVLQRDEGRLEREERTKSSTSSSAISPSVQPQPRRAA